LVDTHQLEPLRGACSVPDSALRISTNVLASRLELSTYLKLIARTSPEGVSRQKADHLIESGEALRPVVMALG